MENTEISMLNAMLTRLNNMLNQNDPEKAEELIFALKDLTTAAENVLRSDAEITAEERLKLIADIDNTIAKVQAQENDTKSKLRLVSNQLKAQKSYKQASKK